MTIKIKDKESFHEGIAFAVAVLRHVDLYKRRVLEDDFITKDIRSLIEGLPSFTSDDDAIDLPWILAELIMAESSAAMWHPYERIEFEG